MPTLETAEQIVSQLNPAELAKFRHWFDTFDGQVWDDQIDADAEAGKLDALANEALAEFNAGKATEI